MIDIKFVACQASSINLYKNLSSKTLKCCVNIYFNKKCFLKKVIPKYETCSPELVGIEYKCCVLTDISYVYKKNSVQLNMLSNHTCRASSSTSSKPTQ